MKYIGPFLRLNSLDHSNILNQMFYLAKESLNDLTLTSKCGLEISYKELAKNIPNFDSNTKSSFNPLLCIYKKASAKLLSKHNKLLWNTEKFKKQVEIEGNAFMTLCLLELCEYYKDFENVDKNKFKFYKIYLELSKKQLEFYASYLRNGEGVFVDKIDLSDAIVGDFKFEDKNKAFKFSNQALLMCAYAKCATLLTDSFAEEYKNFSMDILKMFLSYREDLYSLSFNELLKLSLCFNLYYKYTHNEDAMSLILDLSDLLYDAFTDTANISKDNSLETSCLMFMNCVLINHHIQICKFEDLALEILEKLTMLYEDNIGIFVKATEDKTMEFSSSEVILYLSCFITAQKHLEVEKLDSIISNVYKNQLINSGLILSWPDSPSLDDPERYRNYSLKSDDLLDEQNFRLPSVPTPKNCEYASIFLKKIEYSRKKDSFKVQSSSFDSSKNMFIYFIMIMLYKEFKD